MKILTLCYEYPPVGGGGGRVAQTVARQLVARGHEVRVQTAALGWRSTEESDGGVRIFRTASARAKADTCRIHEMALYCATSFLPSLRHIRQWKPDVIHSHFAVPTGFLAMALRTLTRTPYVITAHLGDVPGGVPRQTSMLFRFLNPLARRVWKHASACTAVSTFVKDLAEKAYRRPVKRILNGIELGDRPLPAKLHPQRRLVFVGRLSIQKNPLFLIEMLAALRSQNWVMTIVGDGPLYAEITQRIAHYGLAHCVTLRGWLDAPEVAQILMDSDILVMPSLSEGLPVAAIEALKYGLAIVSSDIPGMRDVVKNGINGHLGSLEDPAAFSGKLDLLLANSEHLYAAKQASWELAADFHLDGIISQYEHTLREAVT